MAGQKTNPAGGGLRQAMVELAQADEDAIGEPVAPDAVGIELYLSDLVGDAKGEVVIFNDSGARTLTIRTHAAVVAEGQVAEHVTANGEDVSGFGYVRFDNGMTLYFPEGLDLIVQGDAEGGRP